MFNLVYLYLAHLEPSLEKALAPHSSTLAWKIPWVEEPGRLQSMGLLRVGHDWVTSISLFLFHALEKDMATHSSVLAWRIPGAGDPGGLMSMESHRVRHDWSDLAVAAEPSLAPLIMILSNCLLLWYKSIVCVLFPYLSMWHAYLRACFWRTGHLFPVLRYDQHQHQNILVRGKLLGDLQYNL